jgi:hypothetical protein
MASDSPARDFLLPRLSALVEEAVAQGFARDVTVAVLIDIITSPRFDTAEPNPADDVAPDPKWQLGPDNVILPGGSSIGGRTAPDNADFLRPPGILTP